jgi:type I restriction enzyme S subunit
MVKNTLDEGYKQTEIGAIPRDWEAKPIGGEIDLLTGYPFPSSKYVSNGVKLLRGSNIKRGETDWGEDITKYWEKVTFELKPYILNVGDIVIAMDGSLVGRSFARLSQKDLPALLLQRVARVRSDKIDMGYLKEYICSNYFTKYCDSVKTVTAIAHISPQDIRKFIIPLPPTKEEQSKIAQILSDTDALVGSLDKLIEKKKNIKIGAMQELLTGKKRLPGDWIKKKGLKQTEVGIIPEDWEVKKLGEVGEPIIGLTYTPGNVKDNGLLVLRSSNIGETGLEFEDNVYVDVEVPDKLYTRPGDILICVRNGSRQLIGKSALIEDRAVGQTFGAFMSIYRTSYYHFISHIFRSFIIKNQIQNNLGATINQITNKDLREFVIPFPPIVQEQTAIAQVLSDMDSEIKALKQKRDKFKQLKVGLMQQLLTGRIRLKCQN